MARRPGPHEVICPHCQQSITCSCGEDAPRVYQEHRQGECPANTGRRCAAPDHDGTHFQSGRLRTFMLWVGGERVKITLCEPCAARHRVEEGLEVEVLDLLLL